MLKRTKYSRLRNDSLTPLEDRPQRMLPSKRDICLDSDFAQVEARGATPHHGTSTLRDFIPRVANIRLQNPISLRGPRGQTSTERDRTINGHTEGPLSRAGRGSGPEQRFCSHPPHNGALSHAALRCTKRPITLHRVAGLPRTADCPPCSQRRDGPLKTSSAAEDCTAVGTASRMVHHHIKVPITRQPGIRPPPRVPDRIFVVFTFLPICLKNVCVLFQKCCFFHSNFTRKCSAPHVQDPVSGLRFYYQKNIFT